MVSRCDRSRVVEPVKPAAGPARRVNVIADRSLNDAGRVVAALSAQLGAVDIAPSLQADIARINGAFPSIWLAAQHAESSGSAQEQLPARTRPIRVVLPGGGNAEMFIVAGVNRRTRHISFRAISASRSHSSVFRSNGSTPVECHREKSHCARNDRNKATLLSARRYLLG